jgi:hypothetical protein
MFLVCFLSSQFSFAQTARENQFGSPEAVALMNKPIGDAGVSSNLIVKTGLFFSWNTGACLSLAAGGWARSDWFQGSANVSFNLVLGKKGLGNKDSKNGLKNLNRNMVNLCLSTMLTVNLGSNPRWFYEEINPMYYGNRSGVYNSYQSAFTLGTTFITYPKGTYNNITSPRNRSQQLVFVQLKVGGGQAKDTIQQRYFNSFVFNMCEDYLGDFVQPFADLRDRFYTGGGSMHFRFLNHYKVKAYTETYSGNSYVDKQDYPDLVIPEKRFALKKHHTRFAYQDAGQLGLNKARTFIAFEYQGFDLEGSLPQLHSYLPKDFEFFIGSQGGMANAWSQHLIHNCVSEERNRTVFDKDKKAEKLHLFNYTNSKPQLIFGISTESIIK